MVNLVSRTAFAVLLIAAALGAAPAQEQSQRNQPGKFDFYVLSLSWSPSFCKATEDRGRESNDQCRGRPYAFVVHGLWPQYERGFPRDCRVPAPRLSRELTTSMLDLMPARGLIYHEWDQHGTCSGLEAQTYFDLIRKARETVKIPESYAAPKTKLTVAPDEVEGGFVKGTPGLSRAGVSVTCGSTRLSEVRICMSKDLKFRDCDEIDRRACRRDKLLMPPVRGG